MDFEQSETLSGTVEHVIFSNQDSGFTVLELTANDELVTVVGVLPMVSHGENLMLKGNWTTHPSFGKQFKAQYCERSLPKTAEGMLSYLSSGMLKGVGPKIASVIIETFGDDTFDVLENRPADLAKIKGISRDKAGKICEDFKSQFGIREVMLTLSKHGVSSSEALRAWKRFGSATADMVSDNPYVLCTEGIRVPFERADKIAISNGMARDGAHRIRAGIVYVLKHNLQNGHTCLPSDKLSEVASGMLGISAEIVAETVNQLFSEGALSRYEIDGREFTFLPYMFSAEKYAAGRIIMMLRFPPAKHYDVAEEIFQIEKELGVEYDEHQITAIQMALKQGLLILTGGPGTGKTTTLNAIISLLEQKGEKVLLAAPTGRAAKRMSELTGREAKTIHRLLEVEWTDDDTGTFARNEKNTLDTDAVIVDELSMVDSQLFDGLLRALPLGCRLILVGDSDQLPSVGAGNVLFDLIESGKLPVVCLKKIFRQAMESLIITNAHRIVRGEQPVLDKKDSDFFFLRQSDRQTAAELIVGLCRDRLPKTYGYSPFKDIQVLSPGRQGELGTLSLNLRLQEALNPSGKGKKEAAVGGKLFREGDKVMQIKNNYDILWEKDSGEDGLGVFNGDVGVLVSIDRQSLSLTVRFDDRTVLYSFDAAHDLDLAYAVTVHKSQGSEFEAVIIPVLGSPEKLCYRNLLYTGVTRAKSLLLLVGSQRTVESMVNNNRRTKRYSGLRAFLADGDGAVNNEES